MRKHLAGLIVALLAFASPALAQTSFLMPPPAGVTVVGVQVVSTCGAASLTNNAVAYLAMDTTGTLCTKGSSGGTTTVVGTTSNASSAVATSSANIASVAYNYAFNGTTWDQVKSKAASTAAVATDTSIVTQLNPLSPGIIALGQATKANSVPVTFASDQDPCSYAQKSSVAIAITSATTTAMVAVSGSTTVYVCGFNFTVSQVITTANTLKFESGTGTACSTPVASLTGTYGTGGITAGEPLHIHSAGGGSSTIFSGGASNGICAVTTIGASGSFEGVLTYVQQ